MKITANKYVAVTYDLNVGEGEERELMEKATVEAPLKFIYGTGMMLPAFEKALNGLEVGASRGLWRILRGARIGSSEEYLRGRR